MKSILALALVVALSSAVYIPEWKSCGVQDAVWIPTDIHCDNEMVHNEPNTIYVCGNVTKDVTATKYHLNAKEFGVGVINKDLKLKIPFVLTAGSQFCFNYTFTIPSYVVGSFSLEFSPFDENNVLGCAEVETSLYF